MSDPRERQASFNDSSRDHWQAFAAHRRAMLTLLRAAALPQAGRLCALGAGNCHDLDLPALLESFREVHLVDLDRRALDRGVADQRAEGHPQLRLFGGVDLTGMLDVLATWSPTTAIHTDDLRRLAESPTRLIPPALGGPYDVVASTCLLRPILGAIYHAVGEGHPQFAELVRAIRAGHLRLLNDLVAPGGASLLITDIVSSDTLPGLPELPEPALPGLLRQIDTEKNHFHGVGPADLAAAFRRSASPGASLSSASPWRWTLHSRVYLVWALQSRKPLAALTSHRP